MPCIKRTSSPDATAKSCLNSTAATTPVMPGLLPPAAATTPGLLPTLAPTSPSSSPPATTIPGFLTSLRCAGQTHLIIGASPLAAARASKSIDAGAKVVLVAPDNEVEGGEEQLHYGLRRRVEEGSVRWVRREFRDEDLTRLGREEVGGVVELVWVVDKDSAHHIFTLCGRLRIPVNVVDTPSMCSFTLLSTHTAGPLQIGVTTNGNGCKLANRVKREIAASLPPGIGETCERMGRLRRRVQDFDAAAAPAEGRGEEEEEEEEGEQRSSFNALVLPPDQEDGGEDREWKARKRGRWLAQICEYWPLERLCALTEEEAESMFDSYTATVSTTPPASQVAGKTRKGKILLVGSGPGHPDLLTLASKRALEEADLVLADKLVPAAVLELIPRRTPLFIARKFPGNADAAQEELLGKALAGLEEGKCVVRLKQGDPYIYGRGGEEVEFFEGRGYEPVVLPGITSALSAPLFAGVAATHRGVADQVLVCTGTGRKGAAPAPPEWIESRTAVFLMALHRLGSLVGELRGKGWPGEVPCAVVERASCKDQRVIRTTLGRVVDAVDECGSRPPGLLVVGRACEVLRTTAGKGWVVEEGFRGF